MWYQSRISVNPVRMPLLVPVPNIQIWNTNRYGTNFPFKTKSLGMWYQSRISIKSVCMPLLVPVLNIQIWNTYRYGTFESLGMWYQSRISVKSVRMPLLVPVLNIQIWNTYHYGLYRYVFQIWIFGTGTGTRNGIRTDFTEIRDWYHRYRYHMVRYRYLFS